MSKLVQFKLSAIDEERAYGALERSPERNLNLLSKRVFLEFLDQQGGHAKGLESMAAQLLEVKELVQEMAEHLRGTDPGTTLSIQSALFLLMYRSVNAGTRTELDEAFNSDAVIKFLKEGG